MFKIKITIERWKWNEEYQVWVSSEGQVKNKKKKILPTFLTTSGYLAVRTGTKYAAVHRLVVLTFIGPRPSELYSIDHINNNRHDNRAKNLRWLPVVENATRGCTQIVLKGDEIIASTLTQLYLKMKARNLIPENLTVDRFNNQVRNHLLTNTPYCRCYFTKQSDEFICTPLE
jgi:hypothetical protein